MGWMTAVFFEPPTHELRPWYAAADVLFMTSVFEGVPVIVYEALAMELPIVAPALPGIVELMADAGGSRLLGGIELPPTRTHSSRFYDVESCAAASAARAASSC